MSHRPAGTDSPLLRLAAAMLLVFPLAVGCRPSQPRGQFVAGSSCDGVMNYADEITLSNFHVQSETPLGDGRVEVALGFDLANGASGRFASARAFAEVSGLGLEVTVAEAVATPVDLGVIEPGHLGPAPNPWVLRVAEGEVVSLVADLNAGALPLVVHGAEQTHLEPGVSLVYWGSAEDLYYAIAEDAGMNQQLPEPPFADDQEFAIQLVALGDDQESIFDEFDGSDRFYIRADPDRYLPVNVPDFLHDVRVVDVVKSDEAGQDDGSTNWTVTLARTLRDPLLDLVQNGSFCTGEETHVDWPIQASRLFEIDGVVQEDEGRDGYAQPIRFNGLSLAGGDLTLSGQLQGHVLKPSLQLRLREGTLVATVDIENDFSMTAELRAEADVDLPGNWGLYDLCFPLPDLAAGPVAIPMNLQLAHEVAFDGNVRAGAVIGFQKSAENGYTVGFDGRRSGGDRFFSAARETKRPVSFTPPQLLDDTSAEARVSTAIRTTLRVGSPYPFCDTGAGAHLAARAWGSLEVDPAQEPWWRLGHGAEIEAGVELSVFGLDVFEHAAALEVFPGDDDLGAPDDGGGAVARSAGEDQRWSVAIDDIELPGGFDGSSVARLPDGTVLVASREGVTDRNRLVALDPYGAFLWSLKYADGRQPRKVRIPDDHTILIGGSNWLAAHDTAGNLLWASEFEVGESGDLFARCTLHDFVAVPDDAGRYDIVAVGRLGRSNVSTRDACAFRLEWGGANVTWARTLVDDGKQDLLGAVLTRDGHIAAVGATETGPDAFSLDNPMVLKLDVDGNLLWAKSLPMIQRGGEFAAVAEDGDGTLFMAGKAGRTTSTGAALVARIGGDGSDPRTAFLLQDEAWDQELEDVQGDAYVDTSAGASSWDGFADIAPVTGGFVVVGHTGLPDNPYEDDGHAAWAAKIDGRLGTQWYTVFDGGEAEAFESVAADGEGLLVSGWSDSFDAIGDERHLWVSRLSFEGKLDMLPSAGVTSRYLEPGVRNGSDDPSVTPTGVSSMDAPLTVADATLAEATAIADLLVDPSLLCVTRLSGSGRDGAADDCGP